MTATAGPAAAPGTGLEWTLGVGHIVFMVVAMAAPLTVFSRPAPASARRAVAVRVHTGWPNMGRNRPASRPRVWSGAYQMASPSRSARIRVLMSRFGRGWRRVRCNRALNIQSSISGLFTCRYMA